MTGADKQRWPDDAEFSRTQERLHQLAMTSIQRLLVVTHVVHYEFRGQLYALGPYACEIEMWADLFAHVIIAAPLRQGHPPGDSKRFSRSNICVARQPEIGAATCKGRLRNIPSLPTAIGALCQAMRACDAILVRSPGSLGLLGVVLAPLFSRYLVARYTGQWNGFPNEPRTWRFQRALLRSRWWRGPVTIYGRWPNQPSKLVTFFTSTMTPEHLKLARKHVQSRCFSLPLRVIFVGRLAAGKNVDILLQAIANLKQQGVDLRCTIVGDGPEHAALKSLCVRLDIGDRVEFTGAIGFERVIQVYMSSDVLVLASQTESWGKSLIEAMAFGLICVGSRIGQMPAMLSDGRGFVVPPRDVQALGRVLRTIATGPLNLQDMSLRAATYAQRYSLINMREAVRGLLQEHWKVSLYRRDRAVPQPSPDRRTAVSAIAPFGSPDHGQCE